MCGWSHRLRKAPETEVLVDHDEPEQQQLIARKRGLRGGVADDFRVDDLVVPAQVRDRGAAGRLRVLVPGGVVAERLRNDEAVAQRPHSDWSRVLPARAPAPLLHVAATP